MSPPERVWQARKLQCDRVSEAHWEGLTRCVTMEAWQVAVQRLLLEAAREGRVSELACEGHSIA